MSQRELDSRTVKPTLAPLLLLLSAFAAAQTVQKSAPTDQDLTAQQKEMVVKLANLQKNFGKKMNNPGVDLSLREIDRTPTTDRTLVRYELYAKGLPADLTYTLFKVQISGKILKQLDGNPFGVQETLHAIKNGGDRDAYAAHGDELGSALPAHGASRKNPAAPGNLSRYLASVAGIDRLRADPDHSPVRSQHRGQS